MSSSSSSIGVAQTLAGLALLVACGHLAYALTAAPAASDETSSGVVASTDPSSPTPECRCDDAALRSELAELRHTVREQGRALEQLDSATASRASAPGGPAALEPGSPPPLPPLQPIPPSEHELTVAVSADDPLPPIDLFIGIPSGVTISQRADGTVEAKAKHPEQVGEEFIIHALTKGGDTTIIKARAQ